ncbi:PE-PGRS family protein [Tellurirhabdus rosea]|uniref:PE-PGRS family protein n=1 Tax=Tellurirhabdus rosea TaxID=2674997 RepID=UPI002252D112|nr:PE-PGRS family protein [Tellurirhabdus rosea]
MRINFLSALLLATLLSCEIISPNNNGARLSDRFSAQPEKAPVQPGQVDEASGLVDSRTIEGHMWVQEDSGTPNRLNLLNKNGQVVSRIGLPFGNRDWEDLAIGPGPQNGVSYLYMADIGDNLAQNGENYIYRFPEPKSAGEAVGGADRIAFRYADGPRDAEALLLDPQTRDLYIVTKREEKARLYRLAYPQSTGDVMTAAYMGELPLTLVTGGSVSADGKEILLRTYVGVQYWQRTDGQSLADALQRSGGKSLSVELEPQGEAIAFERDGKGFYTLSEKGNGMAVSLNFYKRL